jgi:hypothetical protein
MERANLFMLHRGRMQIFIDIGAVKDEGGISMKLHRFPIPDCTIAVIFRGLENIN